MIIAVLLLAANLDACHVLTKGEVAAVQGESFTAAKLTTRNELTQCFYQLPTFSKSISVDVIRERKFWEEHFDREEEHEREEEAHPPKEIKGLGDDALWIGGRAGGSLYVRKGNAVLRVSVGGPGSQDEKIAKSKRLAVSALKRM
jgi:hypothetical protein